MIRAMTASDIKSVLKIGQECFSDPWQESGFYAELELDTSYFIVYTEKEKILGFAGMQHVCDEGYITTVAVASYAQNTGIGAKLLNELILFSKSQKLSFLTLEVRKSNLAAIHLYTSKGFSIVGMRSNFYFKPKEDALLMTLFL